MTNKQFSVNISIPAHNEEGNIENIIKSVLGQKPDDFKYDAINIYLDGCTDNSVNIVKNAARHHKLIKPHIFPERKGKAYRLNQIYKSNRSDILITFDADIILGTPTTVAEMIKVFRNDKQAMLVAAHQIPIRPVTIIGKAIYGGYKIWDDTRLALPDYDHIQNLYGAASAFRKEFISRIRFPGDITDDRGFLYLKARFVKGFRYTKSAYIYYRPVSTLHDFFKLADRSFSENAKALSKYFGDEVFSDYEIPWRYKVKSIVKNVALDPVYSVLGLVLNILTRIIHKTDKLYSLGMWEMATSTKRAIQEVPHD